MIGAASTPVRLRTGSRRRTPFWLLLPVLLLALLASLPLLYVAAKAWDAGWHSAWQLLWRPYVFRLLGNTLWLMFGVTLLSALLGLALAWCVERSDLPARRFWNVVLCLPFAIPAFVSSFTWVSLSPMYEGLGGAILVMTMSKYPLVYLPVAATLRGIDPSLEESARMLGLSRRQVFLRVTLPLLRPTLAATGLLVALHMLVEFGALSILRYQTFTTAIYQEFELEFSNATAAMLSRYSWHCASCCSGWSCACAAAAAWYAPARAARGGPNGSAWGLASGRSRRCWRRWCWSVPVSPW